MAEKNSQALGNIVSVISFLAQIALPFIQTRRVDLTQQRHQALKELMKDIVTPEHHSLVGYFITLDDNLSEEAKKYLEAAKERIKEFKEVGEIEEVDWHRFHEEHPEVDGVDAPTLVNWSTELEKPLAILPFRKKGEKVELVTEPAEQLVGVD